MVALSVVVITYNEEKNLSRCLSSVKEVADEIVIVDSASTDSTVGIARSFGARVIDHPFEGYGQQKNFATAQASHDWILSLDADEELTPQLIASIKAIKNDPQHNVYRIPRITNYCGKWIKHCGWYPDHQVRLYNRTKGRWIEKKVHEHWALRNTGSMGTVKGDLLHYSFSSISQHLKKIEKYTELAAQAAVEQGKTATIVKIIASSGWHFFSSFFLRLGFLDGFYGLVICRLSAYEAFVKYSKIRLYSKTR